MNSTADKNAAYRARLAAADAKIAALRNAVRNRMAAMLTMRKAEAAFAKAEAEVEAALTAALLADR